MQIWNVSQFRGVKLNGSLTIFDKGGGALKCNLGSILGALRYQGSLSTVRRVKKSQRFAVDGFPESVL